LLIVGIARNPRSVKRSINKKKFIKRTGVKSFIKIVNQNHVIPTRFVVNDFDLKEVKEDNIKTLEAETPLKSNGEQPLALPTETSQTQKPTKKPHTPDSSSANLDSDFVLFNPYLHLSFCIFKYFLNLILLYKNLLLCSFFI
jgi:hypothetical protein